ncbi:hypothetical protein [Prevotella sp.]|uniref:hypothetical protein n=1 Tax=Prevotella sp. TaxID=59823 RepID=UPI0027E34C93|nr:hypothetical protein [Prevotella sp.]
MIEEIKINGTPFYVELADVYGGKMWFICKWHLDDQPSTRKFWTKKELENHLRKIENKIIKRELLTMLHNIHGRAVCYAR